MDKFAVAGNKEQENHWTPSSWKTGRFTKPFFYFLKCDYNDCKVKIVDDKAVNLGNGMGMRVPCILFLGKRFLHRNLLDA